MDSQHQDISSSEGIEKLKKKIANELSTKLAKLKEVQEKRDRLIKITEEKAKRIEELRKLQNGGTESGQRQNTSLKYTFPDKLNDTAKLIEASIDAIGENWNKDAKGEHGNKDNDDPMEIAGDLSILENAISLETIVIEENDDNNDKSDSCGIPEEPEKNEIRGQIEELHEQFEWLNKRIVITKFKNEDDSANIIYRVKCPECENAFVIDQNDIAHGLSMYEKHVVGKHLF